MLFIRLPHADGKKGEIVFLFMKDRTMIDRLEMHPTFECYNNINLRSGKDRRNGYTMMDPDLDRRKEERRKSVHPPCSREARVDPTMARHSISR